MLGKRNLKFPVYWVLRHPVRPRVEARPRGPRGRDAEEVLALMAGSMEGVLGEGVGGDCGEVLVRVQWGVFLCV